MTTLKKSIQRFLFAVFFAPLGGASVSAATLAISDDTVVGTVDLIYATAKLQNNARETELAWVQGVLGADMVFAGKLEGGAMSWLDVYIGGAKSTDIKAIEIDSSIDYFLVKTGKKSALEGSPTHFLFDNRDTSSWAVINLALMGFDTAKVDISKVSHITSFKDISAVPVPAAAWLFGSAALGLIALFRRRRIPA
ncbi:hypothetical protein [Amphritea sp. HPY]|uniref:hypothetical protein n=1 Tax=Amphritea sp. HPY TaxID=3421652 RepID=UPI003D7E3939